MVGCYGVQPEMPALSVAPSLDKGETAKTAEMTWSIKPLIALWAIQAIPDGIGILFFRGTLGRMKPSTQHVTKA